MADKHADPPEQAPADTGERHWGGILLDVAGLAAGLLLLLIVADIWSDGRISRRLASRRQPPQQEETDGAGPAE